MFWSWVSERGYETVMTTLAVVEAMLRPLKMAPLLTVPGTVGPGGAPRAAVTKLV